MAGKARSSSSSSAAFARGGIQRIQRGFVNDVVLTIWNSTAEEVHARILANPQYIVYATGQQELAPNTGRRHVHVFARLARQQSIRQVQRFFGGEECVHVEKARIPESARNYSINEQKRDPSTPLPFVVGSEPVWGKAVDPVQIKADVLRGRKPREILEGMSPTSNNVRLVFTLYELYAPSRTEMPIIVYIWGPTGVGKTHAVYETFKDLGVYFKGPDKWFNNYNGDAVLVCDDFRPGHTSPDEWNRINDRFPHMVERKGGKVPLNSKCHIFTSDRKPEELWINDRDRAQAMRRIKHVLHFSDRETAVNLTEEILKLQVHVEIRNRLAKEAQVIADRYKTFVEQLPESEVVQEATLLDDLEPEPEPQEQPLPGPRPTFTAYDSKIDPEKATPAALLLDNTRYQQFVELQEYLQTQHDEERGTTDVVEWDQLLLAAGVVTLTAGIIALGPAALANLVDVWYPIVLTGVIPARLARTLKRRLGETPARRVLFPPNP